jgi:hypothetical protein
MLLGCNPYIGAVAGAALVAWGLLRHGPLPVVLGAVLLLVAGARVLGGRRAPRPPARHDDRWSGR